MLHTCTSAVSLLPAISSLFGLIHRKPCTACLKHKKLLAGCTTPHLPPGLKQTAWLLHSVHHSCPMVYAVDLSEDEAMLASTSAPNLELDHSSDSDHEAETSSPDIKAFHGDSKPRQHHTDSKSADKTTDADTSPEHTGRGSMELTRVSTDSASAMPIGFQYPSRRPPLRANSTYASRVGMHPRATIKMVSHAYSGRKPRKAVFIP